MEEEKIIKHSRKAWDIISSKGVSYRKKIIGFLEEVAIIILAVGITLTLHNLNDQRHEQELERAFLKGEQADLMRGAESLDHAIHDFEPTLTYYRNAIAPLSSGKIDAAYLDSLSGNLINTQFFVFDDGRYEGFNLLATCD